MTYVSPSDPATIRAHETAVVVRPVVRPTDYGLLILRLVVGAVFVAHGAQKVFVMGIGGVEGFFTQGGIPLPHITAPLVSFLELGGGTALVLGVLTRLAALGLAIDMAGAFYFVHMPAGFFLPSGYEFVMTLAGACLALVLIGPGYISVDGAISRHKLPAVVVHPRRDVETLTA